MLRVDDQTFGVAARFWPEENGNSSILSYPRDCPQLKHANDVMKFNCIAVPRSAAQPDYVAHVPTGYAGIPLSYPSRVRVVVATAAQTRQR